MNFRSYRWLYLMAVPLVGGPVLWLTRTSTPKDVALVATVKRGDFQVVVTTAGELHAPKVVEIQAPHDPPSLADPEGRETFQTVISRIVPEGTVVKTGDFVAELDRAMMAPKLQEGAIALQKAEEQLVQVKLDTALTLGSLRSQNADLESAVSERKLAKEQAAYEAPSIKKQVDLDLEKAERALAQAKESYGTKQEQAAAKVKETVAEVGRIRTKLTAMNQLMKQFTIHAPADGMVVYTRLDDGTPRGVGSRITSFEPTVATIPDFREMESTTYVSEVDVAKVAVGQPVRISLDSDPWKRLTGKVSTVANMGEKRKTDAKVFAVTILIDHPDTTLRPGMTTSNHIETAVVRNALFLPIDAVMYVGDTAYVYRRDGAGIVRQQIQLGIMGENDVVVLRGLAQGDQVLLTEPPNGNTLALRHLP